MHSEPGSCTVSVGFGKLTCSNGVTDTNETLLFPKRWARSRDTQAIVHEVVHPFNQGRGSAGAATLPRIFQIFRVFSCIDNGVFDSRRRYAESGASQYDKLRFLIQKFIVNV